MRPSPLQTLHLTLLLLSVCLQYRCTHASFTPFTAAHNASHLYHLRTRVFHNFRHAYDSYIAIDPLCDEIYPLTCEPGFSFGGIAVTMIDVLDMHWTVRDYHSFRKACKFIAKHIDWNRNKTISVFETNIRVLGGLLSAHELLMELDWIWNFDYSGELLYLAYLLGERLLPAFRTPTGIPYGAVHLTEGVLQNESKIASVAGAGSLLLEFGTLSVHTRMPVFYKVAFKAMHELFTRRSHIGLVGNHINIINGNWVATDSGVGGLIDSYYEYMLKGYILFRDERLLYMFEMSFRSIQKYVAKHGWYVDVEMASGEVTRNTMSSLSAFFAGLLNLYSVKMHHRNRDGSLRDADLRQAAFKTSRLMYGVFRKYGALPESYEVAHEAAIEGRAHYPLRPELVESMFYHHWTTNDGQWIDAGENILTMIEGMTKVACGFASIANVCTARKENTMESFIMSETFKYLYLLFDPNHALRSGKYVFTTEAHPLRIRHERPFWLPSRVYVGRKCHRRSAVERELKDGWGGGGVDWKSEHEHPHNGDKRQVKPRGESASLKQTKKAMESEKDRVNLDEDGCLVVKYGQQSTRVCP